MRTYTIEELAGNNRNYYTFEGRNAKGEEITVEISKCENPHKKNSLPRAWYRKGWTKKELETWWSVQVYATNEKGECRGYYNPTHKLSEDGKRAVLNFEWVFDATEENRIKLLAEVERLAFTA